MKAVRTATRNFLAAALFACFSVANTAWAVPLNGDFSSGLTSWTASGDVSTDNQEAVLGDAVGCQNCARLFQTTPLGLGTFTLEFDFLNGISDVVPDQTFPDVLFATLYFVDNGPTFDPDTLTFDSELPLFDLDYTGTANVHSNATIGASPKGGSWLHFALTFTNSFANAIPFFELFGPNGISGDSIVRIDNVTFGEISQPIPEPGTLLLLGTGILAIGGKKKRRKCGN